MTAEPIKIHTNLTPYQRIVRYLDAKKKLIDPNVIHFIHTDGEVDALFVSDLRQVLAHQLVLVSALLEARDHMFTKQGMDRVRALATDAIAQTLKK